jgi:CelD/BcsL family acetyltransferase involved in cellulose biosynthesis
VAHVDVFGSLAKARTDWSELEAIAGTSPYQALAFAEAWFETVGAARRVSPYIVVARDAAGVPIALLPLARYRRGPFGVAEFLGAKDSNFNLGLFRPGCDWSSGALARLLAAAARVADARVELYALLNQPRAWQGRANPLAALGGRPSPSFGYKSELPVSFEAWRDARHSKAARKKLRKNAERLASMGVVRHEVAGDEAQGVRMLDAFIAQRREREQATGSVNAYESPAARAFLRRLATQGLAEKQAAMELHALTLDDRIIATFGALAGRDRLCGLVVAYNTDPEIARCGPGKLLAHEVVRSAIARGFATFDLGVGETRFKREFCEAPEVLFDTFVAVSALGRAAGAAYALQRRTKTAVKRSPRLTGWARRLANPLR